MTTFWIVVAVWLLIQIPLGMFVGHIMREMGR